MTFELQLRGKRFGEVYYTTQTEAEQMAADLLLYCFPDLESLDVARVLDSGGELVVKTVWRKRVR